MNKFNKKGFTLIEMLVVIAIIAVLVSIVIPTISSSTEKAKAATDAANLRSAKAVATIKALEGYTGSLTAAQCGVPEKSKTDGSNFSCTISRSSDTGYEIVINYGTGKDIDHYAQIAGGSSSTGS